MKIKTYKTYITYRNGAHFFHIKKDLADVLKQYMKTYKWKENHYLFGLSTDANNDNLNLMSVNQYQYYSMIYINHLFQLLIVIDGFVLVMLHVYLNK